MDYLIIAIILVSFAVLYFLIQEKIEIIKGAPEPNFLRNIDEKIAIRKELLRKYLKKSKKITLESYQSLTGVSLEQALIDLEKFAESGFLQRAGEEGQVAYYDLKSSYHKNEISGQINKG